MVVRVIVMMMMECIQASEVREISLSTKLAGTDCILTGIELQYELFKLSWSCHHQREFTDDGGQSLISAMFTSIHECHLSKYSICQFQKPQKPGRNLGNLAETSETSTSKKCFCWCSSLVLHRVPAQITRLSRCQCPCIFHFPTCLCSIATMCNWHHSTNVLMQSIVAHSAQAQNFLCNAVPKTGCYELRWA